MLFNRKDAGQDRGRYASIPRYALECMKLEAMEVRNTLYTQEVLAELVPYRQLKFRIVRESAPEVPKDWDFVEGSLFVTTEDRRFVGQLDPRQVERHGVHPGMKLRGVVFAPAKDPGGSGSALILNHHELWLYPPGSCLDRAIG